MILLNNLDQNIDGLTKMREDLTNLVQIGNKHKWEMQQYYLAIGLIKIKNDFGAICKWQKLEVINKLCDGSLCWNWIFISQASKRRV